MIEDDRQDDMTLEEQEQWEEERALPARKRTGYAERMYEYADMLRKELREQELMKE